VPRYLLINGTEPRWRLHDTVDSADLEKSLARVIENGVINYTLASCNEGETFQSLTINGKNLVTYLITKVRGHRLLTCASPVRPCWLCRDVPIAARICRRR
jgi:hypothetical protein